MSRTVIEVRDLCKHFVLHQQGGTRIDALDSINFSVRAGECVALFGPSGAGKSTLLKALFGNYLPTSGKIIVHCPQGEVDIASADPRTVSMLRRTCISYVSQFLRVIPRVSTMDIVAEPLLNAGVRQKTAYERAATLLARLNLPLHTAHPHPASGRAHCLPGRKKPQGCGRAHQGGLRKRLRCGWHLPRRRYARKGGHKPCAYQRAPRRRAQVCVRQGIFHERTCF